MTRIGLVILVVGLIWLLAPKDTPTVDQGKVDASGAGEGWREVHPPRTVWTPPRPAKSPRATRSRTSEPHGPFWKWVASEHARRVANCESGGDPRAVSRTGKYRGKWQMDADFWRTYGGLRYASRPDLATESDQDRVAYAGWLARGWQPWSCR